MLKSKAKELNPVKEIENIRNNIKIAYKNFSFADDPNLVDAAIYEIKSLEARHAYLLKKVKKDDEK